MNVAKVQLLTIGVAVALANPASVNCAQQGGTTVNRNGVRGQIGYCRFADGRICEEWSLLRNDRCKPPE